MLRPDELPLVAQQLFRRRARARVFCVQSAAAGNVGEAVTEVAPSATVHVDLHLAVLAGAVSLGGHVRDILGGPIAGAEVWIGGKKGGVAVIARTDANGVFGTRVSKGGHELRARASGYAEAAETIGLAADLVVDVVMHPASSIRGVVVRADTTPAPGARVRASSGGEVFSTTTGDQGRFELRDLQSGSFTVEASTGREIGRVRNVKLAPGGGRDVRIELEAATRVARPATAASA
jgi:hypothetical protein